MQYARGFSLVSARRLSDDASIVFISVDGCCRPPSSSDYLEARQQAAPGFPQAIHDGLGTMSARGTSTSDSATMMLTIRALTSRV